ncbi:MAG: tetratricopeptide repeat protein [Nannocystaceae bacterium]
MSDAVFSTIERGLSAIESDDLEGAQQALEQALSLGSEDHVGVLHLTGMLAWASGDLESASGYLMQAVDQRPNRPEVYLDCADLLLSTGHELDLAEATIRSMFSVAGDDGKKKAEGQLLLAQIRLEDDDPEEALEILEEVDPAEREHPSHLSTRGAVLLALDRAAEAASALEEALRAEPEDPDLYYQLGVSRHSQGESAKAIDAMLKVLELDRTDLECEDPSYAEGQRLRATLEEVMEDLPNPVLSLIASAPIIVQSLPTVDQVRAGADPRGAVSFDPGVDDDPGDPTDRPQLGRIIIMRSQVLEQADDDDDVPEVLLMELLAEVRRFFSIEHLSVANVEA